MTEEQIEAKKKFAGEKKASMKRRADHHDYSGPRIYLITLEVEGRKPLFGQVVGDPFAEQPSPHAPRMELSELGRAVEEEWMGIGDYYPQVKVMALQMMPDHLHGILYVHDQLPVHLGKVIAGFKTGCHKALRGLEGKAAAQLHPPRERAEPSSQQQRRPASRGKQREACSVGNDWVVAIQVPFLPPSLCPGLQ